VTHHLFAECFEDWTMSLFGRIIVIFLALIAAIVAAGIVLAIGIVLPEWSAMDSDPVERVAFFFAAFFATSYVGAVAFLPALLVVVVSEAASLRNFLYYGVGGALVGLASYYGSDISVRLENTTDVPPVANPLQLAAAAGIVGGIVYWLIAGRNAGRWRERRSA
jgi:phosphotransferase system  glucose/maltose/N-acetylglucosamine-specific IIC component